MAVVIARATGVLRWRRRRIGPDQGGEDAHRTDPLRRDGPQILLEDRQVGARAWADHPAVPSSKAA